MSTKSLISKNEVDELGMKIDDSTADLKRINRGFSARRYLRSLTKNWDQDVLDTFISDGKLTEDTVYEKKASKRKRVEDDLSILPQAYTFDPSWVSSAVDIKNLQLLKLNELNSTNQEAFTFKLNNKPIVETENKDQIKIYNKLGEVSYKTLDQNDKQKVLSELLFHSVLNNINKHRIVNFLHFRFCLIIYYFDLRVIQQIRILRIHVRVQNSQKFILKIFQK